MGVGSLSRGGVALGAMILAGCMPAAGDPWGNDPDLIPIGPIVEIGRGEALASGPFTFSVYQSRLGTCTMYRFTELDGRGPLGCGGALEIDPADGALGPPSFGSATDAPWSIDGLASDEVAEVWIEIADGDRVRVAPLMSLRPAGLRGQVYFVELVHEDRPVAVVALDAAGRELDRERIDSDPGL